MGLSTHIFSLILLSYVRLRACIHTYTQRYNYGTLLRRPDIKGGNVKAVVV
jgi:hypothetical protein